MEPRACLSPWWSVDQSDLTLPYVAQHFQSVGQRNLFGGEDNVRDGSVGLGWEPAKNKKEKQQRRWKDNWWIPIGEAVCDEVEPAFVRFEQFVWLHFQRE